MTQTDPGAELDVGAGLSFVDDPLVIFRRAGLWTLLCSISAAPSFLWALGEYSRPAMATGVAVFILFYTVATSTQSFHRFSRRPFIRRTLYIGYGLRVACSIVFPLGMILDLFPGLLSVFIVQQGLFLHGRSFVPTLVTTLIQGAFVNVVLGLFMLIVYGFQRLFLAPPPRDTGHCEQCGYDLRASFEFGRCPECGTRCRKPEALSQTAGSPSPAQLDP